MPATGHITLSQLAGQIRQAITESFKQRTYWVVADIIDHKFYSLSGHHYFTLAEKDPGSNALKAKIAGVAWKDEGGVSIDFFQRKTGQTFTSNINALVQVCVNYHPAFGLQLALIDVDTTYTIGILEQQRRKTLADLLRLCPTYVTLVGKAFHTRNNRLRHSRVIQKVAIISSSNAAGYNDFKDTIERNRFGYRIDLDNYFTTVQGEANAEALCGKLIEIYQSNIPYDAVVIIRGGGSQSDFLIFDQFVIARAVAKFPIPIITGIGHHFNETIVDMMACTPVKTPSIAAEFILSHNRVFEESVQGFLKSIVIRSQTVFAARQSALVRLNNAIVNDSRKYIQHARNEVTERSQIVINNTRETLHKRRAAVAEMGGKFLSAPRVIIGTRTCDLDNVIANLGSHTRRYLLSREAQIGHYRSICRLADPVNILKRGFAMVMHNGKIVSDADEIAAGEPIRIIMAKSALSATVNLKTERDGTEPEL